MLSGILGRAGRFELPEQRGTRGRGLGNWLISPNRAVEKDLHRFIRRELRELGVQPPLNITELCTALGRKRGRPILLRPESLPKPGENGLWVDLPNADVIIYQRETTDWHQKHIILHEIGHMLLADGEPAAEPRDRTDEFVSNWSDNMPVFDPKLIRRIARRCSYSTGEECAVELVATMILEWSAEFGEGESLSADPAVRRVEAALGGRRGWM